MDTHEIELRLTGPVDDLMRLGRSAFLRDLGAGRGRTRRQLSVYFDTDDHVLGRAGVVLRVRSIGRRRVQTVKSALAGLTDRREWEREIDGDVPDLTMLPDDDAVSGLLADPAIRERLRPVFETEVTRTVRDLAVDGAAVELAIDRGEVRAGAARAPIAELELELKAGDRAVLYRLARDLLERVPLRLEIYSKSDRGFALLAGHAPEPEKAAGVALDAGMAVDEAFVAIADACLRQAMRNEPVVAAGTDPEGVHQMRVALRRLRSAMRLFRDGVGCPAVARAEAEVRWLAGALGPARDSDVFADELLAPLLDLRGDDPRLAALAGVAAARRGRANEAARAAVADRRYTAMLLDLGLCLAARPWRDGPDDAGERTLGPFAAGQLDRHLKKVAARARRLDRLDDTGRHDLRIRIKRLRYACEFFRSLYPADAVKPFLKRLARLQDDLGYLNDAAVAEHTVADLAAEPEARSDPAAVAYAGGVVTGWHLAGRQARLDRLPDDWKALRKVEPFWR